MYFFYTVMEYLEIEVKFRISLKKVDKKNNKQIEKLTDSKSKTQNV